MDNTHLDRKLARNPVAIVGLSALFPKSRSVREFWSNIVDAADCIEDVPSTHWPIDDYYDADPAAEDKTYCRRGGFLPEIGFDPLEFGLPPNILEVTDVVQLLSLVVARDLLADAGCPDATWYDPSRTGVILGITGANSLTQPLTARLQTPVLKEVVRSCGLSERDADEIAKKFTKAFAPWQEDSFPGMLGNVVAGRIANRFDLGGMNCTVDAACASSLAAVRMAVSELVDGRADLMLTGGCDTENTIFTFMCFSKTPALSKSGRIRPFDDAADGTLIGEGIGMLALKRLDDAKRDRDRVYAVLRGIGSGSDGRSKSIYAPRAEGQQVTLRRAYDDAGCAPDSVELIEAHGTGTVAGDKTELAALREVYGTATDEKQFVALGSLKSQFGHSKAAAGAAGLIKLALALHHKVLPPTVNVDTPNRAFGFEETPFYLNTEARPWVRHPHRPRRRAAVSSFGFGGTNFHCVLEEHDDAGLGAEALHRVARAYLWHGEDAATVREHITNGVAGELGSTPIPDSHARLGFVARTDTEFAQLRDQAIAMLDSHSEDEEWTLPKGVFFRRRSRSAGDKVAALFAGQGSQYVNMGRHAALAVPTIRAAFDDANQHFAGPVSLADVVFPIPVFEQAKRDAQEAALRRTAYAQPAIAALSVGQYRYFRALGFDADGYLGHSFGELTALWAADCFADADYFALAFARGAAMAPPENADGSFDPGAMASVRASADRVRDLLVRQPDIEICNYNAPDQVVVGGATAAVAQLVASCAAVGVQAQLLPVTAAFHTERVGHAVHAFGEAVRRVDFRTPKTTVHANTAGRKYSDDPVENRTVLAEQLLHPVHFADRIESMYADGYRVFVEFGPKAVLGQLVTGILGNRDATVISLDGGPSQDSDLRLKQAAVQLAVCGLPLSGLNRCTADVPVQARPQMSVPFVGVNHVPEARKLAYRDSLERGYRIDAAEPSVAAVPAPSHAQPISASTASADHFADYASDHLVLHRAYLDSQLQVAERMVRLLEDRAGNSDGRLIEGLQAVKDHGLAISEAHLHANQVLRDFAVLDLDRPAASTPDRTDRAVLAASPDAVAPPVVTPIDIPHVKAVAPASPHEARVDVAAVHTALLAIVAEKTGYPVEMLEPSMGIEADLGIDSIKRVEILGSLRERFPSAPEIGPEQLGELRTLRDIADLMAGADSAENSTSHDRSTLAAAGSVSRADVVLRSLPAPDTLVDAYPSPRSALVVDDGGSRSAAIISGLRRSGWSVRHVRLPDADTYDAHNEFTAHLADIVAAEQPISLCLYLATADALNSAHARYRLKIGLIVAKHVQRPLEQSARKGRSAFIAVTGLDGAVGSTGSSTQPNALLGGLAGLIKTIAIEAPSVFCRMIDIAPAVADSTAVELVLDEMHDVATDLLEVGLDSRRRQVPSLSEVPDPTIGQSLESALRADDVFVVTGGGRGVTAACITELGRRHPIRLVLLGRTEMKPEPAWATGITHEADLKRKIHAHLTRDGAKPTVQEVGRRFTEIIATRQIRDTLQWLRSAGARAEYLSVDIADRAATEKALAPYAGQISGVVHGAGVLSDRFVADMTEADIERVFAPKLDGLLNVLAAADGSQLRHLILFSSVAGHFGNRGQSNYAVANEALNRIAWSFKHAQSDCNVRAMNWGPWTGGMVSGDLLAMFEARGIAPIPVATGAAVFAEQFGKGSTHATVSVIGSTMPLARREPTRSASPIVVRRHLDGMTAERTIDHHRIDGVPVLPLTVALGCAINIAEQVDHESVVECRDFRVHKGVVFDGTEPVKFEVEVSPTAPGSLGIAIRGQRGAGSARPHYATTCVGGAALAPVPQLEDVGHLLANVPEHTEVDVYEDGTLFHGPVLRGIRRLLAATPDRLVLLCQLTGSRVQDGAYAGRRYDPVLADLLLQAAVVWAQRIKKLPGLPVAIDRVELFDRLPSDEPFAVVVDQILDSGNKVTSTVTACDAKGRVLQRFSGVSVVISARLEAKFAKSTPDTDAAA